jgi:hypothetical protein
MNRKEERKIARRMHTLSCAVSTTCGKWGSNDCLRCVMEKHGRGSKNYYISNEKYLYGKYLHENYTNEKEN